MLIQANMHHVHIPKNEDNSGQFEDLLKPFKVVAICLLDKKLDSEPDINQQESGKWAPPPINISRDVAVRRHATDLIGFQLPAGHRRQQAARQLPTPVTSANVGEHMELKFSSENKNVHTSFDPSNQYIYIYIYIYIITENSRVFSFLPQKKVGYRLNRYIYMYMYI